MARVTTFKGHVIEEPNLVKKLFNDPRFSILFLPIRIWLGYQWLTSGLRKVDNPAWMDQGAALQGYWTNAVAIPEAGRPPIAFGWYREFLQFMLDSQAYTWFAKLVVYGEILVGIALILGAFTGIAAFFGGFMNWNFIMAGTASTNGLLFAIAVLLILGWKVSGYIGADFLLLRYIGVPWKLAGDKSTKEETAEAGSELEAEAAD